MPDGGSGGNGAVGGAASRGSGLGAETGAADEEGDTNRETKTRSESGAIAMPSGSKLPEPPVPNAAPLEELKKLLNPTGTIPDFEACATKGTGVFETLKSAAKMILKDLRSMSR